MIFLFDFRFTATSFKNGFLFLLNTYLKLNHPESNYDFFPFHILLIYINNSLFGIKVNNTEAKKIERKRVNMNNK